MSKNRHDHKAKNGTGRSCAEIPVEKAGTKLASVASLWIGESLGWLERLCLKSFIDNGQSFVLYSYGKIDGVPDGVTLADASEIWSPPPGLLEKTAPSYLADIFRVHLMDKTDFIWVDTDILCLKPIDHVSSDGFLVGYSPNNAEINNAVMRLPPDSMTQNSLRNFVDNMEVIPVWLRPALRQRVEKLPLSDRLVGRFLAKRVVIGPAALTHFLKENGEASYAQKPEVLSAVPWQFVDVLFNPYGGVDGWLDDTSRVVHLWSNVLKHHKKSLPHPDSFIGQAMKRHGIEQ